MASVNLLDNTIRDGSYALDFCFTPEDTAFLANLLEKAGFPFIEIGHGLGLGACREPQWQMPQPDEAYLRQTRDAIKKSQLGVFFIPGIGTEDDLRLGRDCGMDFVRIGTNVTEAEEGRKFIRLAKKLGYFVAANLMKSYVVTPEEFARIGAQLKDQEVDVVYLVDSAGGMMPHEIRRYLDKVSEVCGVPMGFHGHNN
ncbi:MAG: 4-hydroxy-2-oxovalerate aldolase, partial [Nitrospinales bacterium]